MKPEAAFAIGVLTGVALTAFALASLAPNAARAAVLAAARSTSGDIGLPAVIGEGVARPIANNVRTLVARKVAPWTL